MKVQDDSAAKKSIVKVNITDATIVFLNLLALFMQQLSFSHS